MPLYIKLQYNWLLLYFKENIYIFSYFNCICVCFFIEISAHNNSKIKDENMKQIKFTVTWKQTSNSVITWWCFTNLYMYNISNFSRFSNFYVWGSVLIVLCQFLSVIVTNYFNSCLHFHDISIILFHVPHHVVLYIYR